MAKRLHDDLKDNVYTEDDKALIEDLRILLDLNALALNVSNRGVPLISALEGPKFVKTSKKIAPHLEVIPDSELRDQFREFLRRIEQETAQMKPHEIESLELFRIFLDSKKALYQEIELIIFSISTAAVTVSVESIIESYVSIYEYRNNKNRPITEERAHHEMLIAVNGPELAHADNVIKSSMLTYWKNQKSKNNNWHFTLRSEDIKSYTVSKTFDRISKENPSLPFML